MPVPAIVTLVGVALTVAALAYYLIHVILLLRRVSIDLDGIIDGLWVISEQASPLDGALGEVNRDLTDVKDLLEGLLVSKLGPGALE